MTPFKTSCSWIWRSQKQATQHKWNPNYLIKAYDQCSEPFGPEDELLFDEELLTAEPGQRMRRDKKGGIPTARDDQSSRKKSKFSRDVEWLEYV